MERHAAGGFLIGITWAVLYLCMAGHDEWEKTMNIKYKNYLAAISSFIFFAPALAHAHTGLGQANGFMHGLAHPVSGFDHLLAMVAVGIWASQIGGKGIWAIPATFVGIMSFGGLLGINGATMPFVEEGIAMSVLIFGVLIAAATRLPLIASAIMVGLFAIFHGFAHGAEMPGTATGFAYGMGFALATTILHLCGIGMGTLLQKMGKVQVVRYAGGAIAISGMYLLSVCI